MFLKNLDKLMAKKAINKSILAKESGIPYTTIDGFYKKGWDNVKLSTLLKLVAYFGVSLDALITGSEGGAAVVVQTVAEEGENLTDKEKKVLDAYRSDKAKKALIDKVLSGEALAPVSAVEPEKATEPVPVRKKRRDDIIIF